MSAQPTPFAALPVRAGDREALALLVADPPAGHLVVIDGGPGDLAETVASALGQVLTRHGGGWDLHLAFPEADRWTVAEVSSKIAGPARLVAVDRNVIVVGSADRIEHGAADHLLRTLEEPGGSTLFIFAVRRAGDLQATIRSRVSKTLVVRPADKSERVAALVADGCDEELARKLIEWCGDLTGLVGLVVGAKSGAEALRAAKTAFSTTLVKATTSPQRAADAISDALELLAGLDTKNATAQRARARSYARHLFELWRAEAQRLLRGVDSPESYRWVKRAAQGLDEAEGDLVANTKLVSVLSGLLAFVADDPRLAASLPGDSGSGASRANGPSGA